MSKDLNNIKWKEFNIIDILNKAHNSKAYHSDDLISQESGIPYITRTNLNNGLFDIVKYNKDLKTNPANTISLGAENATYFVQPYEYITGNKMYYYQAENLSLNVLKFITICLNKSLKGGGFGYGLGLTGTRSDKRKFMLPVNSKGEPDYEYMEEYIKEREEKLKQRYKEYISNKISKLYKKLETNKIWKDFALTDIFIPEKGNQNNMSSLTEGNLPLVSAKKVDNGYKMFATKNDKKTFPANIITLNNDGDGGAGIAYYQPAKHLLDSHVTALIPIDKNLSKNVLLYLATAITNQRAKFGHGYSINSNRLKIFRFMLPVNSKGEPDYKYMEDYMKYLEQKKLLEYLEYIK